MGIKDSKSTLRPSEVIVPRPILPHKRESGDQSAPPGDTAKAFSTIDVLNSWSYLTRLPIVGVMFWLAKAQ